MCASQYLFLVIFLMPFGKTNKVLQIGNKWVITAAHCVYSIDDEQVFLNIIALKGQREAFREYHSVI